MVGRILAAAAAIARAAGRAQRVRSGRQPTGHSLTSYPTFRRRRVPGVPVEDARGVTVTAPLFVDKIGSGKGIGLTVDNGGFVRPLAWYAAHRGQVGRRTRGVVASAFDAALRKAVMAA